ncbi:MAG: flavin reductase [Clostridia bacterium]|nr:flavin reductase [Clostridia bacterium]
MQKFVEISPTEWDDNLFTRIGKEWMLISAGNRQSFNMMTASWGGAGVMWNVDVTTAYVRPQRYTYEFMEKEPYYALSFLGRGFKQALQVCGSKSGRDVDKVAETGLTPRFDAQAPYFAESEIAVICKKLYVQDLDPAGFLDPTISSHYANHDYHRMYIGEIVKILKRVK